MPYHDWDEDWPHWEELGQAIQYCETRWRRWGRIGTGGCKEKFGTFRHNVLFYDPWWPIHSIVKFGHVYYRWPKWCMRAEIKLGKVVKFLRIHKVIHAYQFWVYNRVIQQACAKWPNVIDELVVDADNYHLIKGKVDGTEIHNKYWRRISDD